MAASEPLYPRLILDALTNVRYPGNGKNIVELGMVTGDDLRIDGRSVAIALHFDKPTDPFAASLTKSVAAALKTFIAPDVETIVTPVFPSMAEKAKEEPVLQGVDNIIAVSSGKGGVGKSTVAANLAVALAREGYKVGLLDADIFGPSLPKMFGVEDEPVYMVEKPDGRRLIEPLERYGVKMLSIGFLVDKESAVLWRGSMASNALKQLITDADWGELDYFLIDLPPGTSDIHLTTVQTIALTGAVVVTTPNQVALADARKGISMFQGDKVGVPILGLVENMAWFTPEKHPDERYYIFGREGGVELAKKLGLRLLGQIPLVGSIAESGDSGEPIAARDTMAGMAFIHAARELTDAVAERKASLPPTRVVEMKH
ncbi:MAG: Mrp/NBP35 family ATP-binding protein [Pseudoflavonifractor sp.]|nr:Mrp/NBP35 family ATP-binding protein [Alloprevotella sp.]MCM1116801.1 Mrp/NBP35 family ATP-binding protein [Pseudoflavonifractor sp.]